LISRQWKTEPRPKATSNEDLVKFGRLILEINVKRDKQTDRQTDRHVHQNTPIPYEAKLDDDVVPEETKKTGTPLF